VRGGLSDHPRAPQQAVGEEIAQKGQFPVAEQFVAEPGSSKAQTASSAASGFSASGFETGFGSLPAATGVERYASARRSGSSGDK
jgi:hypothetical protein